MSGITNWEKLKLRDIATIRRGASPRPINAKKYFSKKGRGWIRIADVTNTSKYLTQTSQYLSELGVSNSVKVEPNDVIMSICATIGKPIIIKIPACIHDGFVLFSDLRNTVNREFLFYYLKHNEYRIRSQKQVGTQGNLNTTIVGNQDILLPKLPEQTAIANILATVDEAIQKADEVIAKTERIKQAMMQKLLSEGIGHKEFKQTKIGKIPKAWDVKRIGAVTNKTEKIDPTKSEKEFQYVDISSIDNQAYKIIYTSKINKDNAPSRARKLIKRGNLIYATTRPYLRNIALIPQSLDNQICSTGFCVLESNKLIISSDWLFYNILSNRFNRRIEAKMKGATYPAVNDSDLYEELIPIAPIKEQIKMTDILNDISQKLDLVIQRKQKLERIKQGLMDYLLTGKKRVKLN